MNRFLRLSLLAALPLAALSPTPQAGAKTSRQASAPRTVSDYFKLLPESYFEARNPAEARQVRAQMLKAADVDTGNDYLEVGGDAAQAGLSVALFRHAGSVTVAVNAQGEYYSFDLLRRENGRWRNVTRTLVPGFSRHHIYEVPRQGTTIRVFDNLIKEDDFAPADRGRHLYDLLWSDGKFVIRH